MFSTRITSGVQRRTAATLSPAQGNFGNCNTRGSSRTGAAKHPGERLHGRVLSSKPHRLGVKIAAAAETVEDQSLTGERIPNEQGSFLSDAGVAREAESNSFYSPVATVEFSRPEGISGDGSLPLCLYFPGIDGQGLTATSQFVRMGKAFDVYAMTIDASDRTSFDRLVQLAGEFLEHALSESPASRPVYLVADSWGALLALGVALERPSLCHRLVLVNPATTETQTGLSRLMQIAAPALAISGGALPPGLRTALPLALGPALGSPARMAEHWFRQQRASAGAAREAVGALVQQAEALAEQLPPATLDWRLKMMRRAVRKLGPSLRRVEQRVLVVAGEEDRLLPSADEAKRLGGLLQRSATRVIPGAGHSLLQERGVDLVSIIKEEGFYTTERRFTSKPRQKHIGNNFGKAEALELPTEGDLERAFDDYRGIGTLTSPVFFSEAPDGTISQGLDNLDTSIDRPILFIGNHQLLALDMSFMIREFLQKKGRLMRGLTHPMIFVDTPQEQNSNGPMSSMRATFTSFGSVPVGPTTMYRLLQAGEMILLYPGGAREALKKRGEKYELFWPEQAEFVRMAARFGAVIVPFGAIGCEDSVQLVLDSEEVASNPRVFESFLGSDSAKIIEQLRSIQARRGVNADAIEDYLVPPVLAPSVPSRFYFLFRKPIHLTLEDAKDRERCKSIYKTVKSEVQGSLAYLIKKREVDPYKDLVPRLVYEALAKEQAPTFDP